MFKSLLIGASFLALSTAASAQNNSTVTQTGESNQAFVNQADAEFANSIITQIGDLNAADVRQLGVNNLSEVSQEEIIGGDSEDGLSSGNIAIVTQLATADGTFSRIVQDGDSNDARVRLGGAGLAAGNEGPGGFDGPDSLVQQYGDFNIADVTSNGTTNTSRVMQGYSSNGPDGAATIDDFVAVGSDNNSATVVQTAEAMDSTSDIFQGSSNNNAEVTQAGLELFSEIRQDDGGNEAIVSQSADQAQSFIDQNGEGNSATVTQTAASAVGGYSNVVQNGNFNTVTVTQ